MFYLIRSHSISPHKIYLLIYFPVISWNLRQSQRKDLGSLHKDFFNMDTYFPPLIFTSFFSSHKIKIIKSCHYCCYLNKWIMQFCCFVAVAHQPLPDFPSKIIIFHAGLTIIMATTSVISVIAVTAALLKSHCWCDMNSYSLPAMLASNIIRESLWDGGNQGKIVWLMLCLFCCIAMWDNPIVCAVPINLLHYLILFSHANTGQFESFLLERSIWCSLVKKMD
jgi:hypothetical protein